MAQREQKQGNPEQRLIIIALTRVDESQSWGTGSGKRNGSQRHFNDRTGKIWPLIQRMDNAGVESKR